VHSDAACLAAGLRWLLAHLDEPPREIHQPQYKVRRSRRPAVWADAGDCRTDPRRGEGSLLGSPATRREFDRHLDAAPTATVPEPIWAQCSHRGRRRGDVCPDCVVRDPISDELVESGVRFSRCRYLLPMAAAIKSLRRDRPAVPAGFPRVADVALALVSARGDPSAAQASLARRWPVMVDDAEAIRMFLRTLNLLQSSWEAAPYPPRWERESKLAA
jgi:hypothetical protein